MAADLVEGVEDAAIGLGVGAGAGEFALQLQAGFDDLGGWSEVKYCF